MMYNYLSIPLAVGIALCDVTIGGCWDISLNQKIRQIAIASDSFVIAQVETEKSGYLGLMNAGYAANAKQDYLTALNYFEQALQVQPQDGTAQKAIKNISSYAFDRYMQEGYAADRIRDYRIALQNFQKALQLRPDSWYAKQAVSNITTYLAQQPVATDEVENEPNNSFNFWLMLIGFSLFSILAAGLILYLFNKTSNSAREPELENLESLDSLSPATAAINSEEATPVKDEAAVASQSSSESSTPNSVPKTESEDRPSPQSEISTITPHNNLTKLDIVTELIQDLNTSDRTVRRKAVWELAQRGDSRAMKPLVELMIDVDSQERGLILEAMTQIAGRTLKPMNKAIMLSLEDDNSQVKQNAIRDLTRVYDLMSQVTKRLALAVEDSDAQVQDTAKWALKKLNQMPTNSWQTDSFNQQSENRNGINSNQPDSKNRESTDKHQYPLN